MNHSEEQLLLLTHEAFLRRAAKIQSPFMLKGSFVTREYFKNPSDRIPGDLDWLYLAYIDDEQVAHKIFTEWTQAVTDLHLEDGVRFNSFSENVFWRRIEYAMIDDFPTVNTDLVAWIGDQRVDFGLDISFNLPISAPPVPLQIHPAEGESFIYPCTPHIGLQVAWKIHQTLVRPRFKDLLDLIHLVKHPSFDQNALEIAFQTLLSECEAGEMPIKQLDHFLHYRLDQLNHSFKVQVEWDYWRNNVPDGEWTPYTHFLRSFRESPTLECPIGLKAFLAKFQTEMEAKGWTPALLEGLPLYQAYLAQPQPATQKVTPSDQVEDRPDWVEKEKSKGFFEWLKQLFD